MQRCLPVARAAAVFEAHLWSAVDDPCTKPTHHAPNPHTNTTEQQVWKVVCESWPAAPLAAHLSTLTLRCTGPGALTLPASWLLRFPKLQRLICQNGISLDFEDFQEDLAAEADLRSVAPLQLLPPLQHLELNQAELDDYGWPALAGAGLLGQHLTSLVLSRCGLPARDTLLQLGSAGLETDSGRGGGGGGGAPSSSLAGAAAAAAAAGARLQLPSAGLSNRPPFPALRDLTVGVSAPEETLPAVAALTRLRDLALFHLRTGQRAFSGGAAQQLSALTRLTRLVLLPAQAPVELRWSREGDGDGGGAEAGAAGDGEEYNRREPRRLFPLIERYSGPLLV